MPETPDILRASYPDNGWSSWFGSYFGTDYPSACPYGIVVRAPGSTGIFAPFNSVNGVLYKVIEVSPGDSVRYNSTFQPPVATAPSNIALSLDGVGSTHFICTWYFEGGLPPFVYATIVNGHWPNMRKRITLPGPGPPPAPLLSRMGPFTFLTPWNKRGFELLP